jgi:hypothetical protein
MKTQLLFFTSPMLVLTCAFSNLWAQSNPQPAAAREDKTERTADENNARQSTGSVFSVDANSFSITPENVTIPLNFLYNSKTVFADEADKTMSMEQMRTGLPVSVEYNVLGDKMIATKVVATRWMIDGGRQAGRAPDEPGRLREKLASARKKKDAANASPGAVNAAIGSEGTIMGFEQVISIRAQGSADLLQYVVNNSTHYVDSNGQPVPPQFVRTGIPVSVQYVEDSGRRIATQMVVAGSFPETSSVPTQTAPGNASGPATATTNNATRVSRVFGDGTPGSDVSATVGGTLENGFLNPPATNLASAFGNSGSITNGATNTAIGSGTINGTGNGVATAPASSTPNNQTGAGAATNNQTGQAGTVPNNQTGTAQPSGGQPSNVPPSTRQPAVKQPSTSPAGSTTGNGSPTGPGRSATGAGSPSTPSNSSAPAPGRR